MGSGAPTMSLNVRGCRGYVHSGGSRIMVFINFPNNGGILCSCLVSIHSPFFWYQRASIFWGGSHSVPCMQWPSWGKPPSLPLQSLKLEGNSKKWLALVHPERSVQKKCQLVSATLIPTPALLHMPHKP